MVRVCVWVIAVGLVAVTAPGVAVAGQGRVPVGVVSHAVPAARGAATPLGAGAQVTVSVSFAARNQALLTRLADAASAGGGVADGRLRTLFGPDPGEVASTVAYLRSHGLHQSAGGLLTRTFTGSAGDVEAAFATRLVQYRGGDGVVRAAVSAPTLPATAAKGVVAVDGLDSAPLVRPLSTTPPPLQVVSKCSGTSSGTSSSNFPGGYEPAALASSAAYDYQPVLSAAREGQGNALALVEFSNYDAAPVQTYQNCYSTQVPITDVPVNGGATDSNGADEVQMDEEVAAGNAPGLDGIYVYNSANGTGFETMIDRILADRATTHVDEISISWGACEAAMSGSEIAAADAEFKLAAAAGLSVFAASGDSGSSGCEPFNGTTGPAVDFPASDPWVTGVGGTTLTTSATGANRETAWGQPATFSGGGGGGGVSSAFAMPAWQSGAGVDEPGYSSSAACGQTTLLCREVPDVALDANPDSGYVLRLTTPLGNAWTQAGGTSAGAPLMAAVTADVDTASAAAGGQPLGFANPFLYAHPGVFRDITVGTNSITGIGPPYPAATGYDMATGLGSPDGSALATALIAATTQPAADATQLSGIQSSTTITPTAPVTLSGTLNDTTAPTTLMSGRTITITGTYTVAGQLHTVTRSTTTTAVGNWSLAVTTADVGARMTWHAAYAGDPGFAASQSPTQILMVKPTLTTASNLPWNGTQYTTQHGTTATLTGVSTPAMTGAILKLQTRLKGTTTWTTTSITATVTANGSYSTTITFTSPIKEYIRFSFTGSNTGPWLTTKSPARLFVAT
jgi:subtilase family serine protease